MRPRCIALPLVLCLACQQRAQPDADAQPSTAQTPAPLPDSALTREALEHAPRLVETGVNPDSGRIEYGLSSLGERISCPLAAAAAIPREAPEPAGLKDEAGRKQGIWADRGGSVEFVEQYVDGEVHGSLYRVARAGLKVWGYQAFEHDEPLGLGVDFGERDRPLDIGRWQHERRVGWSCAFGPDGRLERAEAPPGTPGGAHTLEFAEGRLRYWANHAERTQLRLDETGQLRAHKQGGEWQLYDERGTSLLPASFPPSRSEAFEGMRSSPELSVQLLFSLDEAHSAFAAAHQAFDSKRPRIPLESELCLRETGLSVGKHELQVELRAQHVFVRMRDPESECRGPKLHRSPHDGTSPLRLDTALGTVTLTPYTHNHVQTSTFTLESAHGRVELEGLEHLEVFEADIDGNEGAELYLIESESCSTSLDIFRIRQGV